MTHRNMPIFALSCRINQLEFASAHLFGSTARGEARTGSDVDLAVL
jgi:predicted nucleotidyltransferase